MSDIPNHEELMEEILLTNEFVWNNVVNKSEIDEWLSNFTGEVFSVEYEHSLALWFLANFVYYNHDEVCHLLRIAHGDFVRKMVTRANADDIDGELKRVLQRTGYGTLGRTSESSAMLAYYFRTTNGIGIKNYDPPPGPDFDRIVFVDDVTLSTHAGSQAWSYLCKEIAKHPGREVHVVTMLASNDAISFLGTQGVEVTSAIRLGNENKAFSDDSYVFMHHEKHKSDARKMAEHYGSRCFPRACLGHSDGQYLFGFWYNTPDNALPILWSAQNGWKPIFARKHKVYGLTDTDGIGTYI